MKLKYDIPNEIMPQLIKEIRPEDIIYAVGFNIVDNIYGNGFIISDKEKFVIFENGKLKCVYKINEFSEYIGISTIGGGYITGKRSDGTEIFLCSGTRSVYPRLAVIAIGFNSINESGLPVFDNTKEKYCEKCGMKYLRGTTKCEYCDGNKGLLKHIWSLSKNYISLLLAALLFAVAGLVMQLISPVLNKIMINDYISVKSHDYQGFFLIIGALILVRLMLVLFNICRGRISGKAGTGIAKNLRCMLYNKIQDLSITEISEKSTGGLISRVTSDTRVIQAFLTQELPNIIINIGSLVSALVMMLVMDYKIALIVISPIPIVLVAVIGMKSMLKHRQQKFWYNNSVINSALHDVLSGIRVVKSFGREEAENKRFAKLFKKFAEVTGGNDALYATIFPIMGFIMGIGEFVIYYLGSKSVINAQMDVGMLVQWLAYTGMIYAPLRFFTFIPRIIANVNVSATVVCELLDEENDMQQAEKPEKPEIQGQVSFKNIRFGYSSHEPVLKNVSFDVNPGEMIGIVGHSGSGKSTLINLVMRLYDVDGGQITIDGIDIKNIDNDTYKKQIGVVLQENYLFTGTIYDNIRYSKPDATYEEIIAASKIASAHDFIVRLPDGYDTFVGEKGQTLSGGERQRVAIARAILNDPKILILDEATSALDTQTEKDIQDALARLIKGRTTFAIAHRLSTLKNADRLIVLDKGKLAEIGTHKQLLAKKGIYYNLVMSQRVLFKMKK